jgi:hypothetical protein
MSKDYNIDMVQKSVSPVLPKTMKSGKSVDFQYKIQIWGGGQKPSNFLVYRSVYRLIFYLKFKI